MQMKSDMGIARRCRLEPVEDIACQVRMPADESGHYGKHIAKVQESPIGGENLVAAVAPAKAGTGKAAVPAGSASGLGHGGEKDAVALRRPPLDPCPGLEGGAAGRGCARMLPKDRIDLLPNVECRKSGLIPKLVLLAATAQSSGMHGRVESEDVERPHSDGLKKPRTCRHPAVARSNRCATDADWLDWWRGGGLS